MTGLVAAEIRKLTTVVTTWVITLVGLLVIALTAAVFTFLPEAGGGVFAGSDRQVAVAIDQIGANSIIVLVVALLAMTTEFRHGTVGRTFQVTPSRSRVLSAKLVAAAIYAIAFLAAGLVVVAGVLGIAGIVTSAGMSLGPATGNALWHGLVGLVLTALFGVAVGALMRSQVVALTVMLVWAMIVEPLMGGVAPRVGQWLPFNALNSLFVSEQMRQGVPEGVLVMLDPALGLLVFLSYVLAAAAAAVVLMRTRDV